MSKRHSKRPLIRGAESGLDQLKIQVMKQQGYPVRKDRPDQVKYEVAKELGVPLNTEYNGELSSKQVGQVGGHIGGAMVREMIRMAQERLNKPEQK
ncbi:alpha/beta-type small acid-soluble spore protein [Fodinisporobacter ferrooxydans]|uniref:Alpha/beta-type small acid-soluble spore protein n=1 Tax=Fodinisporobacter ferrooxydans TaxID=2901836 RepID=A0ABY4CHI3_9BACL|nr:alpha/beta-type small acid-soluble spore protein [Alicyclobacillaceae bacterium MYW30-H2]